GAGQDPNAQFVAGVELVDRRGDAARHRRVDRVAGLRPVDGDGENAVGAVDENFGGIGGLRAHGGVSFGVGRMGQRGAMRSAPSRRMVSPLSMALPMMCWASCAYSSGLPSRAGCGTDAASVLRASADTRASMGVSKMPGAMVQTRIALLARS